MLWTQVLADWDVLSFTVRHLTLKRIENDSEWDHKLLLANEDS